jgi:hypothetical protein
MDADADRPTMFQIAHRRVQPIAPAACLLWPTPCASLPQAREVIRGRIDATPAAATLAVWSRVS